MQSKKWFTGILATAMALSLAGADLASAQCGGGTCGQGAGAGRGNCYAQSGKSDTCPNYQPGKGRKRGQGRQQCLRGSNCPNTPATSAPATQPTPAPSN
jgi:hypothetical protein